VIANPPALPDQEPTRAAIALAGTARFARASAWVLVVLAGLSTLLNILQPLSAAFLISALALINGIVEWRFARRMPGDAAHALVVLARNQCALGVEILAYSVWRLATFSPAEILVILERPELRPLLDNLPPEEVERLVQLLPKLALVVIGVSGVLTALGCWGVAWYYRSRRKFVTLGP
jgi:hypothetical protein